MTKMLGIDDSGFFWAFMYLGYTRHMKPTKPSPAEILAQMAQIQSMERGKLSSYRRAGRPKGSDTYYRLQSWQDGKNHTRHVRPEELPELQAALDGYARFCELSEQYVGLVVERTRAQMDDGIKKKILPYSRHSPRRSSVS
jgi:hypothetical protein